MILRYLVALAIVISLGFALIIPNTSIKIPTYNHPQGEVKEISELNGNRTPTPKISYHEPPPISARSAIIIDAKTGISLFEKNPHLKHLPASTTKLMTALTALENCSPDTVITVNFVEKEGAQMGLEVGEQISVENLLYGLLINSGNDAAYAVSYGCSQSLSQFVEAMNQKAQDLNMKNTHFVNPAGFDNNYQYSTAADLAKLANVSIANPLIAKIVATKSTVVTDISGTKTHYLENLNQLLGVVDGVEGVKTGQTEGSLENLITKTTREKTPIVVAVLGSQERFEDSKKLIEWAFENFQWQ